MVNCSKVSRFSRKTRAPQTMMFAKLPSAKAPKPSEMRVATAAGAFASPKLNSRLLGPVNGVYERISRVSLDYYYGGAQYKNAAALMDKLLQIPYMKGYEMPGGYDKNIVNIVFYSKDVHGELFFFSKMVSELAKAPMSSWADVLRLKFKIADQYTTDDSNLDYLFTRLAGLVRLTYCSSRDTQFCRPKHWEPWPEQPTSVLRAYTVFENDLSALAL
jgi:hypothetical protein